MFTHHICTIFLIIFSFITNYSNIGSLVIFCHMESDILGHAIRFIVQTDQPIFFIGLIGVSLMINLKEKVNIFGKMEIDIKVILKMI